MVRSLLVVFFSAWLPMQLIAEEGPPDSSAVIIPIHGPIHSLLGEFFQRRMNEVEGERSQTVIFEIDSPGGDLFTALEMIKRVEDLKPNIRTVAFIPREGLSAAAIFALACDTIFIGEEARFGDAGPLVIGEDAAFRHAPEKIRAELVTRVRILADRHARPAALAEAMVDHESVVFEALETATGKKRYFTEAEWESFAEKEQWERGLPVHESRKGVFLEVTGKRAVALGLAESQANDLTQLKGALKLNQVVRLEHTWVDTLVMILSSPFITGLLIIFGIAGLLLELSAPGFGIGGVTSLVCFGLFFWSRFLGGTSGWLEVCLLILGAVLVACEIFVLPGFGVAGIMGIGLILLSILMAMRENLLPQSAYDLRELGQQALTLSACVVTLLVIAMLSGRHLVNLPMIRRLTLAPPHYAEVADSVPTALSETVPHPQRRTIEDLKIGEIGRADSPLRPGGRARFDDLVVDVLTEGDFLDRGTPVQVISRSGYRVVVRSA